jgi:methionyl-tRNA formyltransferase
MSIIRVVFMGTPDFAVPALQTLLKMPDLSVVGVFTQPDRPAGRGQGLHISPVKQVALAANIAVHQPEKLRAPGVFEVLADLSPQVIVVAAYGQILRQNVLDLPRFGCINVHASLLPRWRGAAPIQACIRAGDGETGITIMKMDAGLDTGPMLLKRAISIAPQETGGTLHDTLAVLGGEALQVALPAYLSGAITPIPQDEAVHTYAPMLKKEDSLINWEASAEEIDRHVRAFSLRPGTHTLWHGMLCKIHPMADGKPNHVADTAKPGQVIQHERGIAVGTGRGLYMLKSIQMSGKAAMPISAFVNGRPDFIGAQLG